MDLLIFVIAMAALVYGADFIVKESERIALHFDISHFVIGATLVAFGTSLPEMAASMMASGQGKSDMAVANVIGSVMFNITLVLGSVFAIAKTMDPDRDLFAKDSAWILFPVIIFLLMVQDDLISRLDGVLFLSIMAAYLLFLFRSDRSALESELDEEIGRERFDWLKSILFLGIGFILTIGGADFVIESGSNIARSLGVSEWIIGLFMISLGTSLPELVVSLVAIKKGNADLSIGNIIGSNVANFSMVLGSAALVAPLTIDLHANMYDVMVMVSASLALLLILANRLYNRAGAILLFVLLVLFIQNSVATL
jgi:cation:H+ antiporter